MIGLGKGAFVGVLECVNVKGRLSSKVVLVTSSYIHEARISELISEATLSKNNDVMLLTL